MYRRNNHEMQVFISVIIFTTVTSDVPAGSAAEHGRGLGLLLVQLGFLTSRRFGELLAPLGLEQRQAGMLIRLAANEGRSQQALGDLLGLNATRMVFLVDELEQRGLVERRRNPADRRSHALYLTDRGRDTLRQAQQAMAAHERSLAASLTEAEREQLVALLRKVATEQGVSADSLPGAQKSPQPG
jgi:DNA-binding MarR family transcriptional regulator